MLDNSWRRLGMWAACGAQEIHCEIVDSTLGMHLGLWSFTGFEFLYFKYTVYCNSNKKVLSVFLWTVVAISVFLDLEIYLLFIVCFAFLYYYQHNSACGHKKPKDSCFCCCLSILPVIMSFISGSSRANFFFSSFFKLLLLLFSAFHWTILHRPLLAHSILIVPLSFTYYNRRGWNTNSLNPCNNGTIICSNEI